jgi:outer membrane receptor protein involved in Fe transport
MTVAALFAVLMLTAADPPAQESSPATDAAVSAVTVTGARQQVETSIDRRSYPVANDLQAATGSIADVLRNIPSVQVDLQGNISLRGDGNVTVLLDGKPSSQFNADNLAQALQSTSANQIDRIEVMTNPSAEFRADGTGGIINLISKKAKGAGRTGSVNLQAVTGGGGRVVANMGYNSDKLSATGDVSFSHPVQTTTNLHDDLLLNPVTGILDPDRDFQAGQLRQNTIQAHVGADYDQNAKTRLSGSLRFVSGTYDPLNADRFEKDGDTGAPVLTYSRLADQRMGQMFGEGAFILRRKYGEGHDLTLNLTFSDTQLTNRREDDVTPSSPAGLPQAAVVNRNAFARRAVFMADYERPLPGTAKLKLGYDFEYTANFVEHAGASGVPGGILAPDPMQTDNFADDETHNQAYVTYEQPFGKLDALFGLRAEVVHLALDQRTLAIPSSQDYSKLYPTLHLTYDLTGGRRLTASYSKRVLRPVVIDLDPFAYTAGTNEKVKGNPNLRPQDTGSYELGYEARKDASSFLATLYYRQTNNALNFVTIEQSDAQQLDQRVNVGRQANGGFEVVLANKLTPRISYNLSADGYWTELSAPNLGIIETHSAVSGFGRANLNWQMTPKDFLQLNLFVNGELLLPQGHTLPTMSGNIGYRHTVNNKVALMFVIQDPFLTMKYASVLTLPGGGYSKNQYRTDSRLLFVTLVWNFAGKPRDTSFDFAPGGTGG